MPPPSLPKGLHVKVVTDPNGGFKIVTAKLGNVVGPRMDRQKVIYPEGRSSRLTLAEAMEQFKRWETFCEDNIRNATSIPKSKQTESMSDLRQDGLL